MGQPGRCPLGTSVSDTKDKQVASSNFGSVSEDSYQHWLIVVEVVEVTLHKLLSLGGALADKLRTYEVEGTSGYKKVGS